MYLPLFRSRTSFDRSLSLATEEERDGELEHRRLDPLGNAEWLMRYPRDRDATRVTRDRSY
jgi:hypothetical protein